MLHARHQHARPCRPAISLWAQASYAFLAEKERRSGSRRTVEGYSRMLRHFFGSNGLTPDQATAQDVFAWAHGIGLSGHVPSSVTMGARVACLSSFFRFLIRMGLVTANPCDALERPTAVPSTPRGLSAEAIQKLLAVVPTTPSGLRDRAIILTLTLTGRRRAEVMGLTAGSLSVEGETIWYSYRGKGGKTGKRELPRPAYDAILRALAAWGQDLTTMAPDESLWPSPSNPKGPHVWGVLRQPAAQHSAATYQHPRWPNRVGEDIPPSTRGPKPTTGSSS